MYLYTDGVRNQLVEALDRACVDPRVREYMVGPFMSRVPKMDNAGMRIAAVFGEKSHYSASGGYQVVTWAEAPEAMRQALIGGEELKAINHGVFQKLAKDVAQKLSWYVARGPGRGLESVRDHDLTGIKRVYDLSYKQAWDRRAVREAKRQMLPFFADDQTELVLLTGAGALQEIGRALRNCMRNAYTGEDKTPYSGQNRGRFDQYVFIGFRSVETQKWTSLGRLYYSASEWQTHRFSKIALNHSCHEAAENSDAFMPPHDKELWSRLLEGEFKQRLIETWTGDRGRRQIALRELHKITGNPTIANWFAENQKRKIEKIRTFSEMYGRTGIIRFLDEEIPQTVTGRLTISAPEFQEFPRTSEERSTLASSTFGRLYGRGITFEGDPRQINPDVAPSRFGGIRSGDLIATGRRTGMTRLTQEMFDEFLHAYGQPGGILERYSPRRTQWIEIDSLSHMDLTRRWVNALDVDEETDDQRRVREHNVASPLQRQIKKDLAHRQSQRNQSRTAKASPLLARLVGQQQQA